MDIGNVHSGLKVFAKNKPNDVAVVYYDQSLTFRELYERANAMANSLIEIGLKKGDHVALYMKNSLDMMEILYALSITGAVAVPLNYMVEGSSLVQLINRSDAKYMFVEMEQLSKFENILDELDVISKQSTFITECDYKESYLNYEDLKNGSVLDPEIEISSTDLLAILYTSGTTSAPKGAMITHGNHIYRMQAVVEEWEMLRGDVMLLSVPIYHAVGQILVFRPSLSGGKVVITREFDPVAILSTIQEEQITQAFFVPTMYIAMLNIPTFDQYNLSSVKLLISAGSPLSGVLKRKIVEKFNTNLLEFFGSSETSAYTMLYPKDVEQRADSIGQQVTQAEVRLVDEEGSDVGINIEGEFAIRGPVLFQGYYKLPEETENSFLPGGWFRTGDMAKEDEEGFYYLLDRKKDMIISGGINVYPKDIEEVISNHPAVLEAAVIGIPDDKWGESSKAFVVLREDETVSEEELIAQSNQNLAKYQQIINLEFISVLPRNPSGKILKYELRKGLEENKS